MTVGRPLKAVKVADRAHCDVPKGLAEKIIRYVGAYGAVIGLGLSLLLGCKSDEKTAIPSASATAPTPAETPQSAVVSQGLTRAEAKRLLAGRGEFPRTSDTDTFGVGDGVWCESPPKLFGELPIYIQRQLVTLTPGRESIGDNQCRDTRGYHFDVELTALGKQYALKETNGLVDVKKCVEELGEVSGIASEADGSGATVEYAVVKHPTPFGDGRCSGSRTESVHFRRYDDGWRIAQ